MKNKKTFFHLINICLVLLIILLFTKLSDLFFHLAGIIKIFITPVIISLFLYYVLRPIVRKLENKKINKGLLVLIVMLVFLSLLSFLIVYGGAVLKELFQNSFFANIDKNINLKGILSDTLKILPESFNVEENIVNSVKDVAIKITSNLTGVFSQIGDIGTQVILVPFILFYLLKDDKKFSNKFLSVMPKKYKKIIADTLSNLDAILTTYISGQIIVTFIIGTLMFIGYLIIGLPNALLMGIFSMVTAIIPFLGPFLGILPALLIGLTISWSMILKIIIIAVIVQQVEGNLITPNIMKSKLNIHPLLVIIVIILSVNIFGLLGAFIGVPLYLILSVISKTIYKIYKENKKASA